MTIQEITDRNYSATVKRGQITDKTNSRDFIRKIDEETEELLLSNYNSDDSFDIKELADITLVCFSMAKHYNINLVEAMEEKMLYNETRID